MIRKFRDSNIPRDIDRNYLQPAYLAALPRSRALAIVGRFLTSDNETYRKTASMLMAEMFPLQDEQLVFKLAESTAPSLVEAALRGLGSLRSPKAADQLEKWSTYCSSNTASSVLRKTAVSSLARMSTAGARQAIGRMLADQSLTEQHREELAVALCETDPSLLFEYKVRNAMQKAKASSATRRGTISEKQADQMTLNYRRRHGFMFRDRKIRKAVIDILLGALAPFPTSIYWDDAPVGGHLLLSYYASQYLSKRARLAPLDALCGELSSANMDPSEREDAFVALAWMDPARSIRVAADHLSNSDLEAIWALSEAANKGLSIPDRLGDKVVSVFLSSKAERRERIPVAYVLSKMNKTPDHASRIVRLFSADPPLFDTVDTETLALLFWNEPRLLEYITKRFADSPTEGDKRRLAYMLARCCDSRGFSYLLNVLPKKWRHMVREYEQNTPGNPQYDTLLKSLFECSTKTAWKLHLPEIVAGCVALSDESVRNDAVSTFARACPREVMGKAYGILEDIIHTRYHCLYEQS